MEKQDEVIPACGPIYWGGWSGTISGVHRFDTSLSRTVKSCLKRNKRSVTGDLNHLIPPEVAFP